MASYSNIPSTLLLLSLLLFLSPPFIHKPHNLVAADYQLIAKECRNSDNPTTCINSMKPNPAAGKADRTRRAITVVQSISIHGNHLVTNMADLVSKTKDQNLKAVYHDCVSKYSMNENLLASAEQALQSHKYQDAILSVSKAFAFSSECHHYIKNFSSQVPVAVTNKIILYERLSVDAI